MKVLNSPHRSHYGVTKWTFQSGKTSDLHSAWIVIPLQQRLIETLRPADEANADVDIFSSILASASENLLHDDFESLADYCNRLREKGGANIHLIVDNAGFELITDLALAQHLVQSGIASCVTFQLKSHVSLQDQFRVYWITINIAQPP